MTQQAAQAGNALTDGTGISRLTGSKVLKDFVADFLISAAAALATVNITGLQSVVDTPQIAAFAVAGAAIHAGSRAVLKWATS